ncbi:hypothetical protein [Actinomadura sp. 21ATH]|uniref:hypothetical protein n=1 Tax=Actinomadura sp. 21ATH TaxID=1735444 RepID=UPI0035C01D60
MSNVPTALAPATDEKNQPCHCGRSMASCVTCGTPRCLACDPYTSDDCGGPAAERAS